MKPPGAGRVSGLPLEEADREVLRTREILFLSVLCFQ